VVFAPTFITYNVYGQQFATGETIAADINNLIDETASCKINCRKVSK
jgi:hypothetical protein